MPHLADNRWMTNISDASNTLSKLRKLKVKQFHFLQELHNQVQHIGLDGQETEKVFPDIVLTNRGVLPTVMRKGVVQGGRLKLQESLLEDSERNPQFKVGDQLRLVFDGNDCDVKVIGLDDAKSIMLDTARNGDCVVIGHITSDVKSIHYERLYTLCVSGLLELDSEVQKLKTQIDSCCKCCECCECCACGSKTCP